MSCYPECLQYYACNKEINNYCYYLLNIILPNCTKVYIYVCVCVYVCMYIYVCMHIYVYIKCIQSSPLNNGIRSEKGTVR